MKTIFYILFAALACGSLTGCGNKKKQQAEIEREKWIMSLNDSIITYKKQVNDINVLLDETRQEVNGIIGQFDYVNNTREVEGYHILTGWAKRYPLDRTGLVARVTEDGRLELLATLTGANFNEIAVMAGGQTVGSDVVPHDQALNYRAGNLNRVCFTGNRADSIGALISAYDDSDVDIVYMNGTKTGALRMPADQRDMVARTWRLFDAERRMHQLEKELPRLNGKINACRRIVEQNDTAY